MGTKTDLYLKINQQEFAWNFKTVIPVITDLRSYHFISTNIKNFREQHVTTIDWDFSIGSKLCNQLLLDLHIHWCKGRRRGSSDTSIQRDRDQCTGRNDYSWPHVARKALRTSFHFLLAFWCNQQMVFHSTPATQLRWWKLKKDCQKSRWTKNYSHNQDSPNKARNFIFKIILASDF